MWLFLRAAIHCQNYWFLYNSGSCFLLKDGLNRNTWFVLFHILVKVCFICPPLYLSLVLAVWLYLSSVAWYNPFYLRSRKIFSLAVVHIDWINGIFVRYYLPFFGKDRWMYNLFILIVVVYNLVSQTLNRFKVEWFLSERLENQN